MISRSFLSYMSLKFLVRIMKKLSYLSMKAHQALMVSGNTEEIEKTNFTISKEIDFNEKSRYIVFSGIAERKRDISISFYLDGSK